MTQGESGREAIGRETEMPRFATTELEGQQRGVCIRDRERHRTAPVRDAPGYYTLDVTKPKLSDTILSLPTRVHKRPKRRLLWNKNDLVFNSSIY